MKKLVGLIGCVALFATPAFAQLGKPVKDVVELELLTHTEVIEKHRAQSCASIRDAIVAAVRGWMHEQHDDITLMVVRYQKASAG